MSSVWHQTQYQASLESVLHSIFPHHHIFSNARKQTSIPSSQGRYLEVDVWVPELNLCFEFQDLYHYKAAWYCPIPLGEVQLKDDIKRAAVLREHQTLVVIPCWWGGDSASLLATLQFQRPDLMLECRSPEISATPQLGFFEDQPQLMLASFPDTNVMELGQKWWVGEKWDGIRCCWDTAQKQLYSRNKVVIDLKPVGSSLAHLSIDAELWCGRGFFGETQAFMIADLKAVDKAFVRLLCFDEASQHTHILPFENRYNLVLNHIPEDHPIVINSPRFLCASETVLQETILNITDAGGEGVVLRQPLSVYLPGRSNCLFKMKALYMHSDDEGLVVRADDDGTLLLQLTNGELITVAKRENMLAVQAVPGNIVTFRVALENPVPFRAFHKTDTTGLADISKPIVHRIRADLAWDDVLQTAPPVINHPPSIARGASSDLRSWKVIGARRAFFDKFAASKGMNPLNPAFWYSVTSHELTTYDKRFTSIVSHYGGKLSTVLVQVYPDINLQPSQFKVLNSWSTKRRREFFDAFAASKGMDSLSPSFWYQVTPKELKKYDKRYSKIASSCGGNLYSVLVQLYPSIGLQQHKFKVHKLSLSAKRELLNKFAAAKGIDPLNPISWYNISPSEFARFDKNLTCHARTSTMLMQAYPNIGLQPSLFKVNNRSWKQEQDRRTFFDGFAEFKGRDPLVAASWYSVTAQEIIKYDKRFRAIVNDYGGALPTILIQLYPDVKFQKNLFGTNQTWKLPHTRRAFFDKFAAAKRMDPLLPSFWYSVTPLQLRRYDKKYTSIAWRYNNNLPSAVIDAYPDIGLERSKFKAKH